jgi:PAS domain S-box-containing protein
LPDALSVTARALPVCTVALFLDEHEGFASHVWKAKGLAQDRSDEASVRAQGSFAWFTGAASRSVEKTRRSAGGSRFVALPLLVERGHVFGVLQVESDGALSEADVFFVNAAANLLATAIDRRVVTDTAEARIRAQLQFTRALTESLGEGVLAIDNDARITVLNPAAEALLGWNAAAAIGVPATQVLRVQRADGSLVEPAQCPLVRALEPEGRIVSDEQSFLGRDRVAVPVSYTAGPIWSDGRVDGAVVVFRDVLAVKSSERTQRLLASASAALGDSLDYRATLAALVSCTVPAFADLCFVDEIEEAGSISSGRAAHQTDVPATGRAVLVESTSPPARFDEDAGPQSKRVDARGARSLIVVPLSMRGRTFGTVTFGMAESGRRYLSRDLGVAEELGRRAATAIDNARVHRALQDAVRAREDLLAVVSHDLRTPLNTVVMAAGRLLKHHPASERTTRDRRALEMIEQAGRRMERLTDDLLDVSSIEAGHLAVNPAPTAVGTLIAEVLETMAPSAMAKGLELVAHLEASVLIRCDRDRIFQALSNLVGNAIKFTPPAGRIALSANPADGFVRFAVADSGPGIAQDLLPHVFERYRQAAETASMGRGLGLFITKGIIEAHGGTIRVDSVVGVGTTFFFDLPRVVAPGTE